MPFFSLPNHVRDFYKCLQSFEKTTHTFALFFKLMFASGELLDLCNLRQPEETCELGQYA